MNASDYPCLNKLFFHLTSSTFHSLILKAWASGPITHEKKKVFNDSLNYSTGLLHFAWVKNTPFYHLDSKSAIFRNVALNTQK